MGYVSISQHLMLHHPCIYLAYSIVGSEMNEENSKIWEECWNSTAWKLERSYVEKEDRLWWLEMKLNWGKVELLWDRHSPWEKSKDKWNNNWYLLNISFHCILFFSLKLSFGWHTYDEVKHQNPFSYYFFNWFFIQFPILFTNSIFVLIFSLLLIYHLDNIWMGD